MKIWFKNKLVFKKLLQLHILMEIVHMLLLQDPNREEAEEQEKKPLLLAEDVSVSRLQTEFHLGITIVHIIPPQRHHRMKYCGMVGTSNCLEKTTASKLWSLVSISLNLKSSLPFPSLTLTKHNSKECSATYVFLAKLAKLFRQLNSISNF